MEKFGIKHEFSEKDRLGRLVWAIENGWEQPCPASDWVCWRLRFVLSLSMVTQNANSSTVITVEMVAEAMQNAWNQYVGDTGEFPDAFSLHGATDETLMYANMGQGNWASMVADYLAEAISGQPAI